MPKRKVVQIASHDIWFYALCDDGTLWERVTTANGSWRQSDTPPGSTEGRSANDVAQVVDKAKE